MNALIVFLNFCVKVKYNNMLHNKIFCFRTLQSKYQMSNKSMRIKQQLFLTREYKKAYFSPRVTKEKNERKFSVLTSRTLLLLFCSGLQLQATFVFYSKSNTFLDQNLWPYPFTFLLKNYCVWIEYVQILHINIQFPSIN